MVPAIDDVLESSDVVEGGVEIAVQEASEQGVLLRQASTRRIENHPRVVTRMSHHGSSRHGGDNICDVPPHLLYEHLPYVGALLCTRKERAQVAAYFLSIVPSNGRMLPEIRCKSTSVLSARVPNGGVIAKIMQIMPTLRHQTQRSVQHTPNPVG